MPEHTEQFEQEVMDNLLEHTQDDDSEQKEEVEEDQKDESETGN